MEEIESRQYFEKRAEEERAAAEQANDARAREMHLELARRYAEKAAGKSKDAPDQPGSATILPNEFRILP